MRLLSYIGLILGILLFAGLVVWQGIGEIIALLAHSGWGLLLLPLVWLPSLLPTTESWRLVFPGNSVPTFKQALTAIWVGRSINNILPVATIGGEIIKARLVNLWGCRGLDAAASVLVDKTVQVLAVIIWGLIGILLLVYLSLDDQLAFLGLTGFGILLVCVVCFLWIQKNGLFSLLTKLGEKLISTDSWAALHVNAREIDTLVLTIYQNRRRFLLSVFWKSIGLMMQTTEVWLACYLLGQPISLLEALMLKSLTSTLSDVAFIIPNAYGIQEGLYMMLGTLVGFSPDLSLAISLATRIREFLVDLPGVLYWQQLEGKLLIEKRLNA